MNYTMEKSFLWLYHSHHTKSYRVIYMLRYIRTVGVREYWVVNIKKQLVTQYENDEDEFVIRKIARLTDSLTSFVIDGFQIEVVDILP